MSVLNHSPRILTNGLIYCVDAAAKQSYSDGSSTWKNIVDNNLYKGTIAGATHVWQGGAGAGASYFSFEIETTGTDIYSGNMVLVGYSLEFNTNNLQTRSGRTNAL